MYMQAEPKREWRHLPATEQSGELVMSNFRDVERQKLHWYFFFWASFRLTGHFLPLWFWLDMQGLKRCSFQGYGLY